MVYLHHPHWQSASWQEVVVTFLRTFRPEEEVCLVLWVDPVQGVFPETVENLLVQTLESARLELDEGPDIILLTDDLEPNQLARLYAAADCIVSNGDPFSRERAARVGVPTLDYLSGDAWREHFEQVMSLRV